MIRRIDYALLTFGFVCASAFLWFFAPEETDWTNKSLALVLTFLCLIPSLKYYKRAGSGLPVFPFIMLMYLNGYAMPIFLNKQGLNMAFGYINLDDRVVSWALFNSIVGVIMLQMGFGAVKVLGLKKVLPKVNFGLSLQKAKRILPALAIMAIAFQIFQVLGWGRWLKYNVFSSLVISMSYIFLAVFYQFYLLKRLSVGWKIFFGIILVLRMAAGLSTGSLVHFFWPLVILVAVYWQVKRKLAASMFIAAVLGFVLLQPVKAEYRKKVWINSQYSQDFVGRLSLWGELILDHLEGKKGVEASFEKNAREAASRTDYIHIFAHAISWTPQIVPFQQGQTYSYFLVAIIPRALWPEKPVACAPSYFFELEYQFITADLVGSTISCFPQLVEAYVNYGFAGVCLVMFLVGMFYAIIDSVLSSTIPFSAAASVYAVLLPSLVWIEVNLTNAFGNLFQVGLFFTLLLLLIKEAKPRNGNTIVRPGAGSFA